MALKPYYHKYFIEAGCDEAGRGCLAGPVFASAVILHKTLWRHNPAKIKDSKLLTPKMRDKLRKIIEKEALAWAVAKADNSEIDKINIQNASILAMHRAIEKLSITPEFLLIDGNQFKPYYCEQTGKIVPHLCIVKGDNRYLSIAAASILAKSYRDEYMQKLHYDYPEYCWNKNVGYPTKKHKEALKKYGITPYHRISFNLFGSDREQGYRYVVPR